MKKSTTTNELTMSILDFLLRSPQCFAWRNNSLPIPLQNGGFRPAQKRGSSDIVGLYASHFFGIEIKTGKDRLRPEQISFNASVQNAGGHIFIASDFEQFKRDFDEWTQTKNPH